MGTCLDRGIKVVSNAGGLDPAACADARLCRSPDALGLSPTIAYVNGDNLLGPTGRSSERRGPHPLRDRRGARRPLTLHHRKRVSRVLWHRRGAGRGADIVVTGRVTDAALVCGPAAWHHHWRRDNFDALAGASWRDTSSSAARRSRGATTHSSTRSRTWNASAFPGSRSPTTELRRGQARRHGRRSLHRHRHLPVALRDRLAVVLGTRRHRAIRHDRARTSGRRSRAHQWRPRRGSADARSRSR